MMRRHKVVKIDDREITVKELKIKDFIEIMEAVEANEKAGGEKKSLTELIDDYLSRATDARLMDFCEMAPSELQSIWDAFKEVNAAFFGMAQTLGLGKMAVEFKEIITQELKSSLSGEFGKIFAASLKPGT
ncbi:hypothetical protein [Desulfatiglans anilini]|uniref:hypothetical protein n=1 Tax=Desulfatiglans anilini TaxID=90728 RepID=UPI0012946E0D|nr:hypothetical protein [Desulfatiglans anilini]